MMTKEEIAYKADVIIAGYATTKYDFGYQVVNLNYGDGVAVFMEDGTLIETNMDDIQLHIAKKHFTESIKYIKEYAEVL